MEDVEMSEDAAAPWLDEVRTQLGKRAETVNEALTDVSKIAGASSACWPDLRNEPVVTVYVVSAGVLLVVGGSRDPLPNQEDPNDEVESRCDCRVVAITAGSTWSLAVIRTQRTVGPGQVIRRWTFDVGSPAYKLKIEHPSSSAVTRSDPTPFAQALMREIARAGDNPPLDGSLSRS
jgi:hypothetical protein